MSTLVQTNEGNQTMMKLGGVLGELPIEKAFDLARSYHVDRKKQADKTMTPVEQQKMAGLYAHVIHGNWSDSKNVIRRRQQEKTVLGKEWACLDNADREQSMAAYVIMVDQIHKGFTGHVKIRVKRLKDKEAKRKVVETVENAKEAVSQQVGMCSPDVSISHAFPNLMRVHLVPKNMGGPLVPKKDDLLDEAEMIDVVEIGELIECSTPEKKKRPVPKPLPEEVPIAKGEEDAGDPSDAAGSSQEPSGSQAAGGSGFTNIPDIEEFDVAQPSGSGANSERDDDSSSDDSNMTIEVVEFEEEPAVKVEAGTQTCECCFKKAERRLQLAMKRANRKKRKPKPVMVSVCTQTYESVYPQWIFELRRHFYYNAAMDVRYLLDTILGSDVDDKYEKAKNFFMMEIQGGNIKTTHDFTVSLIVMIGIVEMKTIPQMRKEFEEYLPITTENIKTYVRELHYREHFLVKVEFIVGVYQSCKKFASQLSGPLSKAIGDYIGLRDADEDDDEDEEIDVVNVELTDAQKVAKAAKNAKKKASKKKAKKRNADVEMCLERLNKDIKRLREIYAKEVFAKIENGELPADPDEDWIKNHRSKHSPQDCDDTIEYFGNKVWEMYKAMTPDYWTTEDILKWCEEKIATKATL